MITWSGKNQEKHLAASSKTCLCFGLYLLFETTTEIIGIQIDSVYVLLTLALLISYLVYRSISEIITELSVRDHKPIYTDEYLHFIQQNGNSFALYSITSLLVFAWILDALTEFVWPEISLLCKTAMGVLLAAYGSSICWQLYTGKAEEDAYE